MINTSLVVAVSLCWSAGNPLLRRRIQLKKRILTCCPAGLILREGFAAPALTEKPVKKGGYKHTTTVKASP